MLSNISLFLLFHFLNIIHGSSDNKAGPFDLVFQGMEQCPGHEKDEYQYTYKLKKLNRTTWAMDSNFSLSSPLGDSDKFTCIMDVKRNNQWKDNYFRKDFDHYCIMMKLMVPEEMAKISKLAGINSCPFKPGNYTVKNYVLSMSSLTAKGIPIFFYNSYRFRMMVFSNEGRRKLCGMAYIDVVPKRKTKG